MQKLAAFLKRFHSGPAADAYEYLGCHMHEDGEGYVFRVWAPHAQAVCVVGDFNFWNTEDLPMRKISDGVWEAVSVYAKAGQAYKYCVTGPDGRMVYKTDPYGNRCRALPDTSSMIDPLDGFEWHDALYRTRAARQSAIKRPVNIYEVHAGSWKRHEDGSYLNYEELAAELVPYVKDMGYTHIELLPIMEYPYDPSWGYQITCYFAPTHRYGTPKQFMQFVDACHKAGLGVILDWVPAHFPKDENGLFEFDGTCCYELSDPMMNEHPDWTTRIYDYGKPEVQSFLISNVCYWLRYFHVDGIRVDAVASMLYLDYNRRQFKPNKFGGRENLEAIEFLRRLNEAAFQANPAVMMIAEESTAYPGITAPTDAGGLGFGLKWNMGWMHDTLQYLHEEPINRKWHHNEITFSMVYAYSEHYVLPISHDEVVHGKGSLINKMPGEYDAKFANLRTFFGYMMAHPGKKLLFMGQEFGQFTEWSEEKQLDWMLLGYDKHTELQTYVKTLNKFYKDHPAFWQIDYSWEGFQWIVPDDSRQSVVAFLRKDANGKQILVVCNFNPVLREGYTLGAPVAGSYKEILNSDDAEFGGSGAVHNKAVRTHKKPMHGFEQSITITLPPMSTLYFEVPAKRTRKAAADKTDKAGKKTAAKKAKTAAEEAAAKVVKKPGRKPKAEAAATEEKPAKKTARKAKAEPEAAAEAPKKRGRKPKAEAEPKAEKAPAKRTRKPKEPKE